MAAWRSVVESSASDVVTESTVSTLFSGRDVYRVRKLERICCDFGLPVVGGTIIVDLLERIEELEQQVRSLQGFEEN